MAAVYVPAGMIRSTILGRRIPAKARRSATHAANDPAGTASPVAFPRQVTIVVSEATRENLRTLGISRVKDQLANTPKEIASLEQRLAGERDTGGTGEGCGTSW